MNSSLSFFLCSSINFLFIHIFFFDSHIFSLIRGLANLYRCNIFSDSSRLIPTISPIFILLLHPSLYIPSPAVSSFTKFFLQIAAFCFPRRFLLASTLLRSDCLRRFLELLSISSCRLARATRYTGPTTRRLEAALSPRFPLGWSLVRAQRV